MKKSEAKIKFIKKIKEEVLGYSPYGFIDQTNWQQFKDTYFFRSGKIENEEYSANINKILSGAAMMHTISEIEKRLDKFLEKYK